MRDRELDSGLLKRISLVFINSKLQMGMGARVLFFIFSFVNFDALVYLLICLN